MKQLLLLTPILISMFGSIAQSTFYIQNGSDITRVENKNPEELETIEWQVRLYKKGASKIGKSYWGIIKGKTADDVMSKLTSDQEFEIKFNIFIGKGSVQNDILTHFNPLGPIAIIDDSPPPNLPNQEYNTQLTEVNDKAEDYLRTYTEVRRRLNVIIKGKTTTPYTEIGRVFREYTKNLKDAFMQINSLRKMLERSTDNSIINITKDLEKVNSQLNAANHIQMELTTSMEAYEENQRENRNQLEIEKASPREILISNIPIKFKNSISRVIYAGSEITNIKKLIPDDLTGGMNTKQKIHFKNFVEHIYSYTSSMSYCFALLSDGSKGYGYLTTNEVVIDVADQYFRDNVLGYEDILKTDNYNYYYSNALLEKANAAYELFQLLESEANQIMQEKNNILHYGLFNLNRIYEQGSTAYRDPSISKGKQEMISKLQQHLK